MLHENYYDFLSKLVVEFPEFYGKSEYIKTCTVDVNPLKHRVEEMIQFSAFYGNFLEARKFYEGLEIVSYVEDFFVKSYLGADVFLASFSDTGVDKKSGEGFIKNVSDNIMRHIFSPEGERNIAAAAWSDSLTNNPRIRKQAGLSDPAELFKTEIKILNNKNYWSIIDNYSFFDILGFLSSDFVEKEVLNNVVKNFWQWKEQYYYGDMTQTYRFLQHPHIKPNNVLENMYSLNNEMAQNSSFKNPVLSLNECLSRNDKNLLNSAGISTTACRNCDTNALLYPIKNGSGIRPTINLCRECLIHNDKITVLYIKHAANGVEGLNPYGVLLKDMLYGVITEEQLISMAYDFPELKEEILAAKNATESVEAVFALTKPATAES